MGQLTESNIFPVRAIVLSTAQTWRFHDTVHVDYYTFIESTRVVGKPRSTHCLRENATVLARAPCTEMFRVQSRAVIARIFHVRFDLYIHYVHDFPRKNYIM